ncbi:NitT/TauT family transport system ATP-binding protein [Devosia enhydra]|uniref:NitT/TauT family transport system ATP-binding protein n=1 Tax=Devosia enhydra TaxID=665118 RepID=A0A1K2I4S6_9HYPH|nr:ABC transporter ATP-binding protein [Devosia enhydra]SFZ86732.1 NitT/TauT family transport system ATP-binding protein [Devosia enhydra]
MLLDPDARGQAGSTAEAIGIENVSMSFQGRQGPVEALRGINLTIPQNRFISIVGRSGCGKSTLLRIISGLIPQSAGTIRVMGRSTQDYQKEKKFGFVFQEASLFPWKTARDNVRLPLDVIGIGTPAERAARADDLLRLTRLEGFADHYPAQLSGGMRQRVSIARALSYEPEILLMDEPFGALDEFTRREMHDELIRIWQTRPVTVVFVTHSLSEALYLSDAIVVMAPRPGRIKAVVPVAHPRLADPDMRHHPDVIAQTRDLERLIHEQ